MDDNQELPPRALRPQLMLGGPKDGKLANISPEVVKRGILKVADIPQRSPRDRSKASLLGTAEFEALRIHTYRLEVIVVGSQEFCYVWCHQDVDDPLAFLLERYHTLACREHAAENA